MIRISISAAAFDAIASTLPLGTTAFEPELGPNGERFVWLEPRFVDRLAAMRGPGGLAAGGRVMVIRPRGRELHRFSGPLVPIDIEMSVGFKGVDNFPVGQMARSPPLKQRADLALATDDNLIKVGLAASLKPSYLPFWHRDNSVRTPLSLALSFAIKHGS